METFDHMINVCPGLRYPCAMKLVAAALAAGALLGCEMAQPGSPGRATMSNPLRTTVNAPAELRTVNVLLVHTIEIDRAINPEYAPFLQRTVRDMAHRELSMALLFDEDVADSRKGTSESHGLKSTVDEAHRTLLPPTIDRGARARGVDAALITRITRFVARDGSRVGADQPARVDFSLELVRLSDNARLWEGSYHYRDEPLSENLLNAPERLRSGGGFRRAEDLFEEGMRAALRDLASRREGQFAPEREERG